MAGTERRLLFVTGEREMAATSLRVLQVPLRLAEAGWQVDILTHNEAARGQAEEVCGKGKGVTVTQARFDDRFWTMRQRDAFAKTFIKLYSDLVVPGTDMPFWKMVAFDDFLWHVSRHAMARIEGRHDAVMITAPSAFERPKDDADVMYTHAAYHARQAGVPLLALQIYPVTDVPELLVHVVDHWIVNEPLHADFFRDRGVPAARVHLLDDLAERHMLASVGDPYLERLLDRSLETDAATVSIALINHPSNRLQLRQAVEAIGKASVPGRKRLFFVFVGLAVRELTEQDVFEDLIAPAIREHVGGYYTVGTQAMMPVLMQSDVVVATSYLRPLSVAARYGRRVVVFDPLREPVRHLDPAVVQLTDPDALRSLVEEAAAERARRVTLAGVLEAACAGAARAAARRASG